MPPKSFLHPHKGQDFIIFGDDYCCIHIKWFLYVILSWPHRLSLYSGYCKPCCDKNAYQRVAIAVSWYSEVPPHCMEAHHPWGRSSHFLHSDFQFEGWSSWSIHRGVYGVWCALYTRVHAMPPNPLPPRPTEHSLESLSHKYLRLFCFKPAHRNIFTDSPGSPSLSNLKSFARNKCVQQHLLLLAGYAPCRSTVPSLGLISIVRSTQSQ